MSDILEFRGVSKAFSDVQALDGIQFSIPEHSVFGLLGPNGAGKTTLIRIITKIFAADSGTILFRGKDIRDIRHAEIGYMPEEKGLYKKMKVGEQLIYLAALKGMPKRVAKENMLYWFERLDMHNWKDKKSRT
ncbi:MAG: ATP-binding cassette domain-containing protein [Chitinophagales bacterium]